MDHYTYNYTLKILEASGHFMFQIHRASNFKKPIPFIPILIFYLKKINIIELLLIFDKYEQKIIIINLRIIDQ